VLEGCVSQLLQIFALLDDMGQVDAASHVGFALAILRTASAEQESKEPAAEMQATLSPREVQVLFELASGASNKLIARRLRIAEPTVKIHIRNILSKTASENRTQAALWAEKNQAALAAFSNPAA